MSEWLGLVRSLIVYWRPGRQRSLRRLYSPFVARGDLVFDIGAHLGDRSVAFAALGARVVALEPQPHVARWLRWLVRRHDSIQVRTEAVGARAGTASLAVSHRTPTVSSLSRSWRDGVTERHPGFAAVRWQGVIEVRVVTLDELIAAHGVPRFCKIDVEGFEAEVLAGLSRPIESLSFEFVAGQMDVAIACVRRLEELGAYRFNVVPGERRALALPAWVPAAEILAWLEAGAADASSGDVYAVLERG